jgi:hypothetical protein
MSINDHVFSRFLAVDGSLRTSDGDFWILDRHLPAWARRSNPIVRRHLGGFWKASLPALDELRWVILIQLLLLLPSIIWGGFLELISLAALLSMFVLPVALVYYGRALVVISRYTAAWIVEERQGQMLDLLRTTPLSLRSILLSKAAAAIWRQMDHLSMLFLVTAAISLPPIVIQQATLYPPDKNTPIPQIMAAVGLVVSVARLVVEPVMVAALAAVAGASAEFDISAATWATLMAAAYAVLINLPRLLPLDWTGRLVVESVLPIVLPLVITGICLAIAVRLLTRE